MKPLKIASIAAILTLLSLFCGAQLSSPAAVFNNKPDELFQLLMHQQVQKELNITPAQIEKLQARKDQMEELDEPKDANGEPRELTEEEVPAVIAKKDAMRGKAIVEILTPRQQNRLHQVVAQVKGVTALLEKTVLKALDVTEEQHKAMLDARKAAVDEMTKLREQAIAKNASQQERMRVQDKYYAARETIVDRIVAVLKPEQQKRWRELIGDKFVLKIPRPPLDAPTPPGPPDRPAGAPRP